MGLPWWLSWIRIRLQCRRPRFDSWVRKIPWRRERLPTPVFWPGEFLGLYSPWGRRVGQNQATCTSRHFRSDRCESGAREEWGAAGTGGQVRLGELCWEPPPPAAPLPRKGLLTDGSGWRCSGLADSGLWGVLPSEDGQEKRDLISGLPGPASLTLPHPSTSLPHALPKLLFHCSLFSFTCITRLPWWLRQKSVCLQCGRPGFHPWVRKIPLRRKWQPTLVLLPENSHGWRSLVGYSPWCRKESDMTEWFLSKASFSYMCWPKCLLFQNISWKNLNELFSQPNMLASKKHEFLDEWVPHCSSNIKQNKLAIFVTYIVICGLPRW